MSNHFYYDYPFIMSNLTKSEYSFYFGQSFIKCNLLHNGSFFVHTDYRYVKVSYDRKGGKKVLGHGMLMMLLHVLTFSGADDHHPQQ